MCIIIHSPNGVIDDEHLRRSLAVNSDGWGFAVAQGQSLVTYKGLSPDTFWERWAEAREIREGKPILFHARIRTQGKVKLDNCHPFPVGDNWVMAHNGCIWGMGDKSRSDTNHLATVIRAVGPSIFMTAEGRELLKHVIGNNDKLVFLHADGQYVRVNASLGHEANGNWYSNYSYVNYTANRPKVEWQSSTTVITPKPKVGPALGAPGKKTKPRFQEEDISALRPELRKLRADIIIRSATKSARKRAAKRRRIAGLAATTTDDNGKLTCDRGLVCYDDMSKEFPPNKYHDGYSKIDWDAMNEEDWKREARSVRRDDGENTPIPQTG